MKARPHAQHPYLVALAVTVAWPVAAAGGFSARAQAVFIALAAFLLLMSVVLGGASVFVVLRQPVSFVLVLAGMLSLASAAWTVGSVGVAARSGLLCCAYAVIATAAYLATLDGAARWIATGIVIVAVGEALLGLAAVATRSLPEAERLAGVWLPGGSVEYQPALALLEVGALGISSSWLSSRRALAVAAGSVSAVFAGAAIALAADRLAIAMSVAVVATLIVVARADQRKMFGAVAVAVVGAAGAIVGVSELGGTAVPHSAAPGLSALLPLFGLAIAAGLAAIRCARARSLDAVGHWFRVAVGALLVAGLMAGGAIIINSHTGAGPVHRAGFFHGRIEEWGAALQTWWQRPLLGSGAGSYYMASLPHQTVAVSRFAHDLPLEWAAELGIPGLCLGLWLYINVGRVVSDCRQASDALLFAPLVVGFMISNLVDWTWHLAGVTALWAMALGAMIGSARASTRVQPSHSGTDIESWAHVVPS